MSQVQPFHDQAFLASFETIGEETEVSSQDQKFDTYNRSVVTLQTLLVDFKKQNNPAKQLKARGSLWSYSAAPDVNGSSVSPEINNRIDIINIAEYATDHVDKNHLYLASSGMTLAEFLLQLNADKRCLSIKRELNGRSFPHKSTISTFGSHSSQTLAGVMSTGVHGANIHCGPFPNMVRGIHLVCNPDEKSKLIQPHTNPPLLDTLAAKLNADLIRNDSIFKASLVSLGAFGLVAGYIIQTEPRYAVKYRRFHVKDEDHLILEESMKKGTPENLLTNPAFKAKYRISDEDTLKRLRHFEVHLNPHHYQSNENHKKFKYSVKMLFDRPYAEYRGTPGWRRQVPPKFNNGNQDSPVALHDEVPKTIVLPTFLKEIIHQITNKLDASPNWSRTMNNLLRGETESMFKPFPRDGQPDAIVNPLDIIGIKETSGLQMAAGICVEASNSVSISNISTEIFKSLVEGNSPQVLPLFLGIRYVAKCQSTLGWHKWNKNAVLDVDAMEFKTVHLFLKKLCERLVQDHIPFTMHWGKWNRSIFNPYNPAGHEDSEDHKTIKPWDTSYMEREFGTARTQWRQARQALLKTPELRRLFSSAFTDALGLTNET